MFPEILRIGPITIRAYGFFVAIAFLVGINYLKTQTKSAGFSPADILDLCIYILISGIVGARIFYVLLNWEFYKSNLYEVFFVWSGGLVFYGGLLFGFVVGVICAIKKKLDIWHLTDLFAPAIFLGVAIARIGCFCAGCCYGKPTGLPWGIVFTNPNSLIPETALGIKLHPAQLYESLFCFILFVVMHNFNKMHISIVPSQGRIFFISLIAYSFWRFFIEFLRWDDRGTRIFGLFPSQFFSIIIVLVSIIALWILNTRKTQSQ